MPNKFARSVAVEDFKPRGLLPDGLIPISRADGSAESELASAAGRVAATTGAIADDLAREEGKEAGNVAGLDPHYRPDGSLTIRGKAFNDAATKTYLNRLDAEMRTDMQATFELHRDNPKNLKAAFDELRGRYVQDGPDGKVFPQIRGEFDAQFARMRIPYQNKALGNFEELTHSENRASLIEKTTTLQTTVAKVAALDPNGPDTAKIVASSIAEHAKAIDEQVANQSMSADHGAKLKVKFRDDALVSAALGQAAALKTPEDIATYRENVKKKFAAGKFEGLSADGYATLDTNLGALQNSKRTEINTGVTQLGKNLDDYIERAASGFNVTSGEWTQLATAPGATSPKGAVLLQSGEAKLKVAALMSRMSIEDQGKLVSGMRAQVNKDGSTSASAEVVQFAEQQLEKQRKAIDTDQLGYAENKRLVPAIAPLDFQAYAQTGDAATLAAQFRDRTGQARAIGTELSRAPVFLRPEEKERLKEIVDRGGAPALQLAGAVVKGAGNDAPAILREISSDAPLLAQAGNIIANGGSMSAARDAFEAARIRQETGKDLPGVPTTTAGRVVRDTFGTAFAAQGEDGGRIRATADAIAKTRINAANIDPAGGEAETIYQRALQEAAGATFINGEQYGGVGSYRTGWFSRSRMVPVPSGVRASAFRDVIGSITDADLKALPTPPQTSDGKPYSARDLSSAVPVAVNGGYRFAMGDPMSKDPQFMRGADGKPFVLPFEAVTKFAPRVPRAMLGGS